MKTGTGKLLSHEEKIAKAIAIVSDLDSGGGLTDLQTRTLVDYVVNESKMLSAVRSTVITGENWNVQKVGLGSRVALAKKEATDPMRNRKARFDQIRIEPFDITLPFEISENFFLIINLEMPAFVC